MSKTILEVIDNQLQFAKLGCAFSIEETKAIRETIEGMWSSGWRCCIDHILKPEHPCPICKAERLDAELVKAFARIVPVEQYLLDAVNGKHPLPDKDKCLELARKLGVEGE